MALQLMDVHHIYLEDITVPTLCVTTLFGGTRPSCIPVDITGSTKQGVFYLRLTGHDAKVQSCVLASQGLSTPAPRLWLSAPQPV